MVVQIKAEFGLSYPCASLWRMKKLSLIALVLSCALLCVNAAPLDVEVKCSVMVNGVNMNTTDLVTKTITETPFKKHKSSLIKSPKSQKAIKEARARRIKLGKKFHMSIKAMRAIVDDPNSLTAFHSQWNATFSGDLNHTVRPLTPERRSIFKANMKNIIALNQADNGFNVSANHLTHYSFEEMQKNKLMHAKTKQNARTYRKNHPKSSLKSAPAPVTTKSTKKRPLPKGTPLKWDWRSVNGTSFVTSVKNQPCGTCWAYSSTAAIESAYLIANPDITTVEFSIPNAIAGGTRYNTSTVCNGGESEDVFKYTFHKAITTNSIYPMDRTNFPPPSFPDTDLINSLQQGQAVALNSRFTYSAIGRDGLIAAVIKQPVVIYVAADASFQSYSSGIWSSPTCNDIGFTNHAILLVGYNFSEEYWIAKNSWDTDWGLEGYIKIKMADDLVGTCMMYVTGGIGPGIGFESEFLN